jgi:superfamily II DNA or RNA helicase
MATFEQFRSTFPEDNNEKGEAFEVFLAEWMFDNHNFLSRLFKRVWRFSDWPKAWSGKDIGTDLIAEDYNGKICAIQAKFYKEESSIPKGDVDSFLSDSARSVIDYRYLIATTDRIGLNATVTIEGQEKPVHMFLLSDFLDPFNWPKSLASLNKYKPRKPHKPRPHQKKAINDVTKKLKGRGQLIMACGTGKTLTGQRIVEKLECKTTLVLLPSLLLLSKTVKDWISEREQDFIFLPVCSDQSVTRDTDEIALSRSELAFRSTTDATEIADFLKRKGNKVIFSTYQSSPQIAEAFKLSKLRPFDLILADEAHRCAGKISAEFSTVLDNDKLPAKRRLFMTATPRMYTSNLRKKAKEADIQIASMDDEAVFGPVLHRLTFGQAIANTPKPLLTDYRVLVVGVNEGAYRAMVKERTLLKTESGLEDDARSLATQLGLSKAVRDYDLKRVISFHSRVNLARDFASSFLKFQEDLKPKAKPKGKITYSHVSGKMPTSERSKRLRALGSLDDQDRYLLGNARCLSEGVDVPALDGVAFVDPKRSEIDIIQAVGRAIRLSKGKEIGTIVIPVFLSDSDDPDEVLSTSEFDQVWKVVNALRSHDEALGEMLDEFRTKLGRKQKVSFRGSKIVFDVPRKISREFVDAFETRLVETTTASWSFWLGLLLDYKSEFGDCLVPDNFTYKSKQLGPWVRKQRSRKEQLSAERIQRLDDLGFVWDPISLQWEENFKALEAYKSGFGDCLVPAKSTYQGKGLGNWVDSQRQSYKTNSLAEERIARLEALEFVWDPREIAWQEGFEALRSYRGEYGDCDVPVAVRHQNINLGVWVNSQRNNARALSDEKIARLESIDFVWDALEFRWEKGFSELMDFLNREGHCNFSNNYTHNGFKLGQWVSVQRAQKYKGKLPTDKLAKLNSAGIIWEKREYQWELNFQELQAFSERNGNCDVPSSKKSLVSWIQRQRAIKEQLSPAQIRRLEGLGFSWNPIEDKWEEYFTALMAYFEEHGNSNVPQNHVHRNLQLGAWLSRQRGKKGTLSEDQIERMEHLNVVWEKADTDWNFAFDILTAFREQQGNCLVPARKKFQDFNLGAWVDRQRQAKKNDKLSSVNIQRLDSIGFEWDVGAADWDRYYEALLSYRKEHGNCDVPSKFTVNGLKLGGWVNNQRNRPERLTEAQQTKLKTADFIWSSKDFKWQQKIELMTAYYVEHSHLRPTQKETFRGEKIGQIVMTLRGSKKQGALKEERIQQLEAIGMTWTIDNQ